MICAKTVFKCFRSIERFGDRITGAAGPFFVAAAAILLTLGTFAFFEVILPSLAHPWLAGPPCLLIAVNLGFHYYHACTVPPGFVDAPHLPLSEPSSSSRTSSMSPLSSPGKRQRGWWPWAKKRKSGGRDVGGGGVLLASVDDELEDTDGVRWWTAGDGSTVRVTPAGLTMCKKCNARRPERAHHCRICNRCVRKYDHHCPWINQCVGIYNERHFVLFMVYITLATFWLCVLGYPKLMDALGLHWENQWSYYTPETLFILIFILAFVLWFAVGIMLIWHMLGVIHGETSPEAQDHEIYRKVAKERGEVFVNSYDLGWRKNLELFFNVGQDGYPLYTLLLPLRVPPYTDGRSWARPANLDRHQGVHEGEEVTEEEDEYDD